jgi:hypothetical protein
MESFGPRALQTAVSEALFSEGHHWLTDEQMDLIVSRQVTGWRRRARRNRQNRKVEDENSHLRN